ncbi:hypothetical protein HYZ98_02955 [Candidatus Peregrinibacteria bacterium]|nr:hypothetical protein [Candidatus Peregrinibacteria bacterium]
MSPRIRAAFDPVEMNSKITIIFPEYGEEWSVFLQRLEQSEGDILVVLSGFETDLLQSKWYSRFLDTCQLLSDRIRIATKRRGIVKDLHEKGVRVLDRMHYVRELLADHADASEALRRFSPHLWQQQIKSQLQRIGLLSLPKIRILLLATTSTAAFFFIVFKLLPSAEIHLRPQEDTISQTANIFLVRSGALLDTDTHVQVMPLIPLVVHAKRSITFNQITRRFVGKNAKMEMTLVNESDEPYSFLKGTRLMNQAGIVFRIQDPINIQPGERMNVRCMADDIDYYGEPIGERGNVPANLKWDLPGLSAGERIKIYGTNDQRAAGGTTAYRTVLEQDDLDMAVSGLKQELLQTTRQLVQEELLLRNSQHSNKFFAILEHEELTQATFTGFVLPYDFLGEPITSVPVSGEAFYTVLSYDAQAILDLLSDELRLHVREGKTLLASTLTLDRLVVHVIDYADDLSWIKLTVDLTGSEKFVLDPLSLTGIKFGKQVRGRVAGVSVEEAVRTIKNMEEVEDVSISLWPPWKNTMPTIPVHISIQEE